MIKDEEPLSNVVDLLKIKKKYDEYDKVLITLDCDVGDLTKFRFMEQCDFYILIGRSNQIDEFKCRKFFSNMWERDKKCLGFFLID